MTNKYTQNLKEEKQKNVKATIDLIFQEPHLTNKELAIKLGFSLKSISNYLNAREYIAILYPKGTFLLLRDILEKRDNMLTEEKPLSERDQMIADLFLNNPDFFEEQKKKFYDDKARKKKKRT